MKKCLITGTNSYIGNSLSEYLQAFEECATENLSLRGKDWQQMSFSSYDTIFHMVGKAHADIGKVSKEEQREYYTVNCDLALQVARKARKEGVSQFVYMSSTIVYGDSAPVGKAKHITSVRETGPTNFYGDSKLRAEEELLALENDHFRVAIVRAPMVYGKGSKGNFPLLARIAEKTPIFPSVSNQRSMVYIENLTEFLRLLAESGQGGIFHPQNAEYVTTAEMVCRIAAIRGKRIRLLRILNPFVRIAARIPGKLGGMTNKAFGSLTIDPALSQVSFGQYAKYGLEESIRRIYENQRHNDLLQ